MLKEVNVTTIDIQKGIKQDGSFCPVARAIKRKVNNRTTMVGTSIARIHMNDIAIHDARIKLPLEVVEWIKFFDSGVPVKPIKFKVEIPDEILHDKKAAN